MLVSSVTRYCIGAFPWRHLSLVFAFNESGLYVQITRLPITVQVLENIRGHVNIVKNLLNHGAVIHRDENGQTPFMRSCSKGNLATVKLLYSRNKFQLN